MSALAKHDIKYFVMDQFLLKGWLVNRRSISHDEDVGYFLVLSHLLRYFSLSTSYIYSQAIHGLMPSRVQYRN